jgi:CHAP domain
VIRPLIAAGAAIALLAAAAPGTALAAPASTRAAVPAGVRAELTRLYAAARHIRPADIAGLRPGSLREHHQASTRTWWATAGFLPRHADPARVLDGFQDGAATVVFTRRDGGRWRILRTAGSRPLGCRGALPASVQHAWRLTAPAAACTSAPAFPDDQAAPVSPPTASAAAIAALATQNVGIGDTPASTNWSRDCDPYTTMVSVSVGTGGCGTDPTFGVQDENEEWCADFAKWLWVQAGVTADLGTLDPAAASFYTWGQQQGESMPTDPGDPVAGDAVVFYPAGSPPNGNYADHVGIITGVNAGGTVDLVNGDFVGASNITVQENTDVSLGSWSAAVWAQGEQWIFVSPSGPGITS